VSDHVFVVVRKHGWDKDEYIAAYLERPPAEEHRDQLNGPPDDDWDPQFDGDHAVWTIPLRTSAPVTA